MSKDKELEKNIKELSAKLKADIILYSGDIDHDGADQVAEITRAPQNKNVLLVLCTPGGLPGSAYKIAKRLQTKYEKFYLYVYGYCKSAGTLIAIGSDEIIMGELAEFGPLDVQVTDGEEIGRLSSGLNVFETLRTLNSHYHDYFRDCLIELVQKGGLSTKNAAPISASLAGGMYGPILSNVDPLKIGELGRAMKIGIDYGQELIKSDRGNITMSSLISLATQYNDHGYVIDISQATEIFKKVREDTEQERAVGVGYEKVLRYPFSEKTPTGKDQIVLLLYGKEAANDSAKKRGSGRTGKKSARTTKDERANISELKPKTAPS